MLAYKQQLMAGSQARRPACAPAAIAPRSSAPSQVPPQLVPAALSAAAAAPRASSSSSSSSRPSNRGASHVCAASGAATASKEKELKFDVSVSVTETGALRRSAVVTVPAAAVKDVFKRGVKRIEREVIGGLRGWQAGKPLPLSMVIQQLGGQAKFKTYCLEELLLEVLPKGVETARSGKLIDPSSVEVPAADFPGMLERYDPAKEFSFTLHFDVAPPVVWRTPLDTLEVTIRDSGDFSTDAAAADDLIRQYRKQHGFSRVAAGRGLAVGDTLVMDMQIRSRASGQVLPGLDHTRFTFDTEQDVLGVNQGMLGLKVGESRTFDMVMPSEYNVEFWQDMPVKVSVKVHEIFAWTLPEFDDAYVEAHHPGKWSGAAEMREALIASTAMQRVQEMDKALEDAVVKAVVDALDIPEVPPRMVEQLGERQFQAQLLQMIEDRIGSQEDVEKLATEEMAAEYVEKRRKELEDQVKFNLAVDDIFASKGLVLEEEAVQAEFQLRERQMVAVGQPFDREEMLDDVRETVKSVTVIEWLKDNVKRVVLPYAGEEGGADGASGQTQQNKGQPVAA